jgi:VanZ family protein
VNVKPRWIEPGFALLTAGVLAVILYGSLYPFQFHRIGVPWAGILSLVRFQASGTDIVSNVLLYWPLGLSLFLALPGIAPVPRAALIVLCGVLLSVSMELAQIFDVGRLISWGDVFGDTAGTAAGVVTAAVFRGRSRAPFVSLMLASWLGYQLFPYAILTGWPRWMGEISPLGLAQRLVVWLAVALLIEAQAGAERSRLVFAWAVLLVLPLQAILSGAALPREQLWSGALALLIWNLWLWRLPRRAVVVAALFFIHVGVDAMRPFQFLAEPRHFGWVPFYSFLMASRESAVRAFLEKAFLYGTLVWALARAGLQHGRATLMAAVYVLALRLAQTHLPGRSAEITDALMVLGIAGVMGLLDRGDPQALGEATKRYPTPRTVTR